jgi:hypothetical protein
MSSIEIKPAGEVIPMVSPASRNGGFVQKFSSSDNIVTDSFADFPETADAASNVIDDEMKFLRFMV